MSRIVVAMVFTILAAAKPAAAQMIWAGAAGHVDVHRFPHDVVPNRLDGVTGGGTVMGGVRLRRHIAIDGEWSQSATIRDASSLTLDFNGRAVSIQSTLTHRTYGLTALGGFRHELGSRVEMSYLAGVSWVSIERTFTTNAAGVILVSPSDPGGPTTSETVDRSVTPAVGINTLVRLNRHISALAGARFQALPVDAEDFSGSSVRVFAGGAWVF